MELGRNLLHGDPSFSGVIEIGILRKKDRNPFGDFGLFRSIRPKPRLSIEMIGFVLSLGGDFVRGILVSAFIRIIVRKRLGVVLVDFRIRIRRFISEQVIVPKILVVRIFVAQIAASKLKGSTFLSRNTAASAAISSSVRTKLVVSSIFSLFCSTAFLLIR